MSSEEIMAQENKIPLPIASDSAPESPQSNTSVNFISKNGEYSPRLPAVTELKTEQLNSPRVIENTSLPESSYSFGNNSNGIPRTSISVASNRSDESALTGKELELFEDTVEDHPNVENSFVFAPFKSLNDNIPSPTHTLNGDYESPIGTENKSAISINTDKVHDHKPLSPTQETQTSPNSIATSYSSNTVIHNPSSASSTGTSAYANIKKLFAGNRTDSVKVKNPSYFAGKQSHEEFDGEAREQADTVGTVALKKQPSSAKKGLKDRLSMMASFTTFSSTTNSSQNSSSSALTSSSPSLLENDNGFLSRSLSLNQNWRLTRSKSKNSAANTSFRTLGTEPEEAMGSDSSQKSQPRLYDASVHNNVRDISFHISMEILSTEKNYAESLEIILTQYMKPIKEAIKIGKPIISGMDVKFIFSQIPELYEFTKGMIKDLEENFAADKQKDSSPIVENNPKSSATEDSSNLASPSKISAEVYLPGSSELEMEDSPAHMADSLDNLTVTPLSQPSSPKNPGSHANINSLPSQEPMPLENTEKGGLAALAAVFQSRLDSGKFQVYMKFVDNYASSKSAILRNEENSPAYKAFIQERMGRKETLRQSLNDLLIMPIQRIARYVLLLSDLRKHVVPEHPHFPLLEKAVNGMRSLANSVNEVKRKEEEMTRLFEVQKTIVECPPTIISANRRVLHEVQVLELTKNRGIRIVVFSDRILFAKSSNKLNSLSSIIAATQKKDKTNTWKLIGIYGLNQVTLSDSPLSPSSHESTTLAEPKHCLQCHVDGSEKTIGSTSSLDLLKNSSPVMLWTLQFTSKREKTDFLIIFNDTLKKAQINGEAGSKSNGTLNL